MEFQRTERTLRTLEGRSVLSVEDTLGLITDILADVQSGAGGSPDKLELGDIRGTLTSMSAVGRVLLQINKSKSEELGNAADRKKRFDKIAGDLENICNEIESSSDIIEKLSQRENELKAKLSQLENNKRQAAMIEENCTSITQECERLENIDIVQLKNSMDDEQKKLDAARARFTEVTEKLRELTELSGRIESDVSEKTDAIQRIENEINDGRQRCTELEDKLSQLDEGEKQLNALRDELEQKYAKAQADDNQLGDTVLPSLKARLQEVQDKLAEKQKQAEEYEQKINELSENMSSLENDNNSKLEKINTLKSDLEKLNNEIQNGITEQQKLEEQLKAKKAELEANKQLSESHREEIARYRDILIPAAVIALDKRSASLDEYAARSSELKRDISQKEDELEQLEKNVQELAEKINQTEKRKAETEQQIAESSKRLSEIQDQIGNLDDQKQKMMSEISSKEEQLGMSDVSELQKKYEDVCAALEENQRLSTELEKNIAEKTQEITRLQAEHVSLENTQQQLKAQLESEAQDVAEMENRAAGINEQREKLKAKHDELAGILNALNDPSNEANVRICEAETEVMQDAIDKLFPDVDIASLTLFERKDQMERKRAYFKNEITDIRQRLEEYKKEYRKLIKAIEGGTA